MRKASSAGLIGEIGIHNIDAAGWFLNRRPTAVTGFGSTILWNDGREVPGYHSDGMEYPRGARMLYDATLANSFDSEYDMYYGTDATVMLRDRRGWMFKEVDSALLGWAVYARKETFFKEVGIVLAANATKLAAQGDNPVIDTQVATQGSLFYALQSFIRNADLIKTGVEGFHHELRGRRREGDGGIFGGREQEPFAICGLEGRLRSHCDCDQSARSCDERRPGRALR